MAHIKKMGDKKWRIAVEAGSGADRKRKYKTVSGVTKSQAEEIMAEMMIKLKKNHSIDDGILFAEHIEEWFESHNKTVSAKTIESYRQQLDNHIIPGLGHLKLRDLSPRLLQGFFDDRYENGKLNGPGGLSERSVEYLYTITKLAISKAMDWQRIARNPMDGVKPPKDSKDKQREEKKTFDVSAVENILSVIDRDDYRRLFEFVARTGLRRGELLGLQWDCVNFSERNIIIKRNMQRLLKQGIYQMAPKNAYSRRTIPLSNKAFNVLREIKKEQSRIQKTIQSAYKNNNLVFCWQDGRPMDPDTVTHAFKRYARKAGHADLTLHDFRHAFASILISQNVDMKLIQLYLGHGSYQTTADIYVHPDKESLAREIQKIDQAIL